MVKISSKGTERTIEIDKEWLKKSFDNGHYVESIILIHYLLEVRMNSIFDIACDLVNGPGTVFNRLARKKTKEPYITSEYRYLVITEILCDLAVVDVAAYKKLKRFNTARNDAAHRLFKKIPTKTELKRDFDLGMGLLEKIQEIYNGLFDKRMKLTLEMVKSIKRDE